jgi:hypothetical protein
MTDGNKSRSCPDCGQSATGNFCNHCGASLGGRFCNHCGGKLAAGAKFCSECGGKVGASTSAGAPARGSAGRAPARGPAAGVPAGAGGHREAAREVVGGQNLPWWIAGGSMFVLILVVGLNMVRPGAGPVPNAGGGVATGAGTAGAPPDISQMTPLEAADRLFNRVMTSVSSGDSLAAQQFMPMAIAAYQRARPLSLDGLFHLSMLNRTAGNYEAALGDAVEILDQDPNHLLGLAAAAEASVGLGELDEAEGYYRKILEIFPSENGSGREEYQMHSSIMVQLEGQAEAFLAGR